MKEVMVLRNLECIKSIAHPKRIDILNKFKDSPLSAKQLSELLEEPHAKINYHIKMLYKAGVLELVEEKIKSGIVEKYYYPTAKSIEISNDVLDFSLEVEETEHSECVSKFKNLSEQFFDAAEADNLENYSVEDYKGVKLSESEISELKETLQKKIDEIATRDGRNENLKTFDIDLVSIPMDDN